MSKYHSKKITVGGMTFDSKKEAARYQELYFMQKAGLITDLKRQVKFELIPSQKDAKGKVIERPVAYIADFVYKVPVTTEKQYCAKSGEIGSITVEFGYDTIVEDVKGMRTADYILKRKMMLWIHGIRIHEV